MADKNTKKDEDTNMSGVGIGTNVEESKNDSTVTEPSAKNAKSGSKNTNKIEVDKDFLLGLQAQVEEFKKTAEKLMAVADKNRLAQYDQRHSKKLIQTAKMSFYEGKAVLAWRTVKDEVFIDGRGVYHETQIVALTLEDGSEVEVNLLDRARRVIKVSGEIIKRMSNPDGEESIVLALPDGRQFELDVNFLN